MPHPGHLCVSSDCKFVLNTYVGKYIVSTVGEYWPDSQIRKIIAKCRDIEVNGEGDNWDADYMKKIGYQEIGMGTFYETMVFKAIKGTEKCCPWVMMASHEQDAERYSDAGDAFNGHLYMCKKWSKK